MRTYIGDYKVVGTPQEIATLLRTIGVRQNKHLKSTYYKKDTSPKLEDTVAESQALRKKLQEDPNYDPYPGVVASKEPAFDNSPAGYPYLGDEDTGIRNAY